MNQRKKKLGAPRECLPLARRHPSIWWAIHNQLATLLSLHQSRLMQPFRTWIIVAFVGLLGLCTACRADTVTHIDLRTGPAEPVDCYVIICARESEPWGAGHTFVVWVQRDKRTSRFHSQGFGFYPAVEKVVMRLFTGDGAIRDESTKSASVKPSLLTHRLIVQVNRDAFEASLDIKEQWRESHLNYHLFHRNCTHFAHNVMKAIHPDTPRPEYGERPSSYVGRLMALDRGRNQPIVE